jgi:hypothetical protein
MLPAPPGRNAPEDPVAWLPWLLFVQTGWPLWLRLVPTVTGALMLFPAPGGSVAWNDAAKF